MMKVKRFLVLQFPLTYSNDFCPKERKSGLCHDRPPAQETTFGPINSIELSKCPWILPIAEPQSIMVGASAEIKDNAQNDKT